ncbi:hypothetical protein [Desulfonatronum lacustre]|uniref:hypothetical protein n=1 Tax=Desulfonatronum lacustre TaxID=66849 RepID=UPI00048BD4F4|nr:hypothetical protein [Desulfonatronum lacustre]
MTLTYPKAGQLSVGYDPKEDRLFLIFHIQDGGFRKAFVSRRILGALLGHMSEQLASSHPMAGYTAQRDEMLQMEHVASVSVQNVEAKQPKQPAHPKQPQQALKPQKSQQLQQGEQLPTEFPGAFYVTSVQVEMQQDMLVVGFSGEWLKAENQKSEPIAALGLARAEAHRVLRLLRDKADSAGWNLEWPALWMKPLEYGKALGAN